MSDEKGASAPRGALFSARCSFIVSATDWRSWAQRGERGRRPKQMQQPTFFSVQRLNCVSNTRTSIGVRIGAMRSREISVGKELPSRRR
jgi:hypothetical protein